MADGKTHIAIGVLQWGHGPKAVETGGYRTNVCMYVKLQWGHGPKAVETRPVP